MPFPHLRFLEKFLDYFPGRSANAYEQQMRREDTLEVVKRWIPVAIGGVICLLCAVSVYSYWTYRQDKNLFRAEVLYDQYIEDLKQNRIPEAKKKQGKLKESGQMDALADTEAYILAVSTSSEKTNLKTVDATFKKLDSILFPKNREQTSFYHATQFLLAIRALDQNAQDSYITKMMKNYLQGENSFYSLAYAIQALQKLSNGLAEIKALEQWEGASGSWIASACIMGAEISRPESSSKK